MITKKRTHKLIKVQKLKTKTRKTSNGPRRTRNGEHLAQELHIMYHSLVDHLPVCVFRKDAAGRFVFVNPQFCQLKGLAADQLVGRTESEISGAERAAKDHELIMRTGEPIETEEEYRQPDGSIKYFQVVKSPVHDAKGKAIGSQGMILEITQRKRAEAELGAERKLLEETRKQLEQLSRMASMADVATTALHHVSSVLNSVTTSGSELAEKVRVSKVESVRKLASLVQEHANDLPAFFTNDSEGRQLPDHMTRLADQLALEQAEIIAELSLLRGTVERIKEIVTMQQGYARVSGVVESVPPVGLVEDALRLNAGAMEWHHVKIVREFAETLPLLVDKHRVLQILVNLIHNAKDALDGGQNLEKVLTLRVAANGEGRVKISVSDNGIGIPAENLTRIFEQGFTTRKGANGLGLHSSALAARELGGSLTASSEGVGKGATFVLELPCQPGKREANKPRNSEEESLHSED